MLASVAHDMRNVHVRTCASHLDGIVSMYGQAPLIQGLRHHITMPKSVARQKLNNASRKGNTYGHKATQAQIAHWRGRSRREMGLIPARTLSSDFPCIVAPRPAGLVLGTRISAVTSDALLGRRRRCQRELSRYGWACPLQASAEDFYWIPPPTGMNRVLAKLRRHMRPKQHILSVCAVCVGGAVDPPCSLAWLHHVRHRVLPPHL